MLVSFSLLVLAVSETQALDRRGTDEDFVRDVTKLNEDYSLLLNRIQDGPCWPSFDQMVETEPTCMAWIENDEALRNTAQWEPPTIDDFYEDFTAAINCRMYTTEGFAEEWHKCSKAVCPAEKDKDDLETVKKNRDKLVKLFEDRCPSLVASYSSALKTGLSIPIVSTLYHTYTIVDGGSTTVDTEVRSTYSTSFSLPRIEDTTRLDKYFEYTTRFGSAAATTAVPDSTTKAADLTTAAPDEANAPKNTKDVVATDEAKDTDKSAASASKINSMGMLFATLGLVGFLGWL